MFRRKNKAPQNNIYQARIQAIQEDSSHRADRHAVLQVALTQLQDYLGIIERVRYILTHFPNSEMYAEALAVMLDVLESPYGTFGYIAANGALVQASYTAGIWEKCDVENRSVIYSKESMMKMPTWGIVYKEHRTVVVNHSLPVPPGHIEIMRLMIVPILYLEDELIGMIAVGNKPRDYDDIDQRKLETIAAEIAPVLGAHLQALGVGHGSPG